MWFAALVVHTTEIRLESPGLLYLKSLSTDYRLNRAPCVREMGGVCSSSKAVQVQAAPSDQDVAVAAAIARVSGHGLGLDDHATKAPLQSIQQRHHHQARRVMSRGAYFNAPVHSGVHSDGRHFDSAERPSWAGGEGSSHHEDERMLGLRGGANPLAGIMDDTRDYSEELGSTAHPSAASAAVLSAQLHSSTKSSALHQEHGAHENGSVGGEAHPQQHRHHHHHHHHQQQRDRGGGGSSGSGGGTPVVGEVVSHKANTLLPPPIESASGLPPGASKRAERAARQAEEERFRHQLKAGFSGLRPMAAGDNEKLRKAKLDAEREALQSHGTLAAN